MKVLLVGGSGMVGTFITPYLRQHHELRVLDVAPPHHADMVEYVQGSISDPDDVAKALEGMDTFIDLVMRSPQGGDSTDQDLDGHPGTTTKSTPWGSTCCCGSRRAWASRRASTPAP